jgi:TfoX/Sxy family transcriptional regulator of competence genes
MATTGYIMASSREKAESVGRAWCLRKASGQMQQIRFIAVEDPILADESILEDPRYAS